MVKKLKANLQRLCDTYGRDINCFNKLLEYYQKSLGWSEQEAYEYVIDLFVDGTIKQIDELVKEEDSSMIKETTINYANGKDKIVVGKRVKLFNKDYYVVGYTYDSTVFANLQPKNLEEAMVQCYTDNEIEELIEKGYLKGYRR